MENKSLVKLGTLNRYEALCALFNNAKTQGLGMLHYVPDHTLSLEEALVCLSKSSYVDYLEGRVIKVDFPDKAEELDCTLYDRDNGEGSAEKAIRRYEMIINGYGTNDIYIPIKYASSECKIVLRNGITHWEYSILGGTLSIFNIFDSIFQKVVCTFEYVLPIPNTNRYLHTKKYAYDDVKVDEVEFDNLAHSVIIMAVEGLLKGDKENE